MTDALGLFLVLFLVALLVCAVAVVLSGIRHLLDWVDRRRTERAEEWARRMLESIEQAKERGDRRPDQ